MNRREIIAGTAGAIVGAIVNPSSVTSVACGQEDKPKAKTYGAVCPIYLCPGSQYLYQGIDLATCHTTPGQISSPVPLALGCPSGDCVERLTDDKDSKLFFYKGKDKSGKALKGLDDTGWNDYQNDFNDGEIGFILGRAGDYTIAVKKGTATNPQSINVRLREITFIPSRANNLPEQYKNLPPSNLYLARELHPDSEKRYAEVFGAIHPSNDVVKKSAYHFQITTKNTPEGTPLIFDLICTNKT